ncbi:MAG: 2-phospho-L-lactate transferase [Pseudomonadota bacterium]
MVKITLLAGGVGGAKMAEGFDALPEVDLTIIGNVGDDEEFHGLWVSPDIDTLTYTLADLIDREQGWGASDEGLRALSVLKTLGEPTWMTLGDKDLGLHIYRTMRRHRGDRPSDIAADVAKAFGVKSRIVLPTDDRLQTRLETDTGELSFQEYFVRDKCLPKVSRILFSGASAARPTPESQAAIADADLIVIAPSNPMISIDPILAVAGLRDCLLHAAAPIFAVSPIIGGKAVKGPAAGIMSSLGMDVSPVGVATHYREFLSVLFFDEADAALAPAVESVGVRPVTTKTLMKTRDDKAQLAAAIISEATMKVAA